MGKPFKKELLSIKDNIFWAENQDISTLCDFFETKNYLPLLAIGSGGSLSACYYLSLLYEKKYSISKALTPLDFIYSKEIIRKSKIIFISASGKNSDIQFALNKSQEFGNEQVANLSMKSINPLQQQLNKLKHSYSANYELPTGKDGFLATNSLVSFFVLLYRCFTLNTHDEINRLLTVSNSHYLDSFLQFVYILQNRFNFTVLYGGWGLPVAYDIESKLTEAALGAVQVSDYRNFGHGRHHWFDKQKSNSSIIALVTPNERKLAEKTLSLIPNEIPRLIINTDIDSPLSSIDLLIKSFYLISYIGDIRKIDPGKPHVPDFGCKLYNLKYSSFYNSKSDLLDDKTIAITRKGHVFSFEEFSSNEKNLWINAYNSFINKIKGTNFTSLLFDYDGTLSHKEDRYINILDPTIKEIFLHLLVNNIKIGIVTGRGKSIKKLLRDNFSKEYWDNIFIGYYNGADVGKLSDDFIPNSSNNIHSSLKLISDCILNDYIIDLELFKIDLRPLQLTIETKSTSVFKKIKTICNDIINLNNISNVLILESSHSMDLIIRPKVSKINIITKFFIDENVLCIGDKGCFPGNDFELLSTKFSLSVDEVSYSPESCWNLAPKDKKNLEALLFYLKEMVINNGYFTIFQK